jgi:hypothetical protein
MFKLMLIVAMYWNGQMVLSQDEYEFNTLKQCEYVRDFHKNNLESRISVNYVTFRISAECFQK